MIYRIDNCRGSECRSSSAYRGAAAVIAMSVCLAQATGALAGDDLSLAEAVTLAIAIGDPTVTRFVEATNALEELAIADSQLPDPQLSLGLINWPTNSFDFEQEPMTQVKVGVRQQFPRGGTLEATRLRRLSESAVQRAAAALQERRIVRDTRAAWLEIYYWQRARGSVRESREAVRELVGVIERSFATGLQNNQDLLRAELELSLLDDRALDIERQIERRKSDLARFIGPVANTTPLSADLPALPPFPSLTQMLESIVRHPALMMEQARIDIGARNVDIAKAQYRPGFSVDLSYGVRGADRADFGSVMLLVDIPLFTGQRQDRRLKAAQHNRVSAEMDRAARLLEFKQALEKTHADWSRSNERVALYERVVLQRSASNAEAALAGYQNRVTDFAELIRSRLVHLDTELKRHRLEIDRALAHSRLLFIAGEDR